MRATRQTLTQTYNEIGQIHPVLADWLESQDLLFDYEVRLTYLERGLPNRTRPDFIAWSGKDYHFFECKPFCQRSVILYAIWQLNRAARCVPYSPIRWIVVPQDMLRRDTQDICNAAGMRLLALDIPASKEYRNPFKSPNRRVYQRDAI